LSEALLAQMATRDDGLGRVTGLSVRRSNTEKSAVLAAMPTAIARTAIVVKPGVLRRARRARRMRMGEEGRERFAVGVPVAEGPGNVGATRELWGAVEERRRGTGALVGFGRPESGTKMSLEVWR